MAHAKQILHNLLDKIANEQNYENHETKLSMLSNVGANFTSFLFEATISAKGKDDLNLFAKVAALGEEIRAQAPVQMFDVEAHFYEKLLGKYKKLEEDHNLEEKDRLITPKFFGTHSTLNEETIVLEDLRCKGFTTLDRFDLLTWEYASTAVNELAKFHALSFAYVQEDSEGFAKELVTLKFEFPMSPEIMEHMFGRLTQKALAQASEENHPKFAQFINTYSISELMQKYFMPHKNVVLRHGDFRASNLMHKNNEDGSITVIPIDYQTVQAGDPLIDLFYLVFCGTDRAFRAAHWTQLLEHYYEKLSAAMRRLGVDPEKTYSRETFDESVKETMPYALVVALTILPLVTVEEAPEVGIDANMDTFMEIKQSEVYRERLNGILSDCIEWGVL